MLRGTVWRQQLSSQSSWRYAESFFHRISVVSLVIQCVSSISLVMEMSDLAQHAGRARPQYTPTTLDRRIVACALKIVFEGELSSGGDALGSPRPRRDRAVSECWSARVLACPTTPVPHAPRRTTDGGSSWRVCGRCHDLWRASSVLSHMCRTVRRMVLYDEANLKRAFIPTVPVAMASCDMAARA